MAGPVSAAGNRVAIKPKYVASRLPLNQLINRGRAIDNYYVIDSHTKKTRARKKCNKVEIVTEKVIQSPHQLINRCDVIR